MMRLNFDSVRGGFYAISSKSLPKAGSMSFAGSACIEQYTALPSNGAQINSIEEIEVEGIQFALVVQPLC